MIKRSTSRNTRAKGFKVKQIVQILLLLGVCIWLIYQVKHSHDKKKELNDDDGVERLSGKIQNDLGFPKLGRKDLNPRVEEARTSEKVEEEEEEEETGGEDEERRHEEEEAKHEEEENQEEEESKHDDVENDGRGGGDDEIDENDQETEENADFIDDEKAKDDEEEEILSEDNDQTHEAREEHYKGDDASSAVTHDTRLMNVEMEETNLDSNNLEHEEETNPVHDSSRIMEEGTEKTIEDENSAAVLDLDQKKSSDKSLQDSIQATQLNEQYQEPGNGSTENLVSSQTQQNEGETVYNSTDTRNFTINIPTDGSSSNDLVPENGNSSSNLTISLKDENENVTNKIESVRAEETGSGSSELNGELGATEEETDGANGSENAAQEDPIDSSDSVVGLDETRIDLDTLPEIRTEIDNSDETAAE